MKRPIGSKHEAVEIAKRIIGLDSHPAGISAQMEALTSTWVPFLGQSMIGREVWHVRFEKATSSLRSVPAGLKSFLSRTYSVKLDVKSGTLISIESRFAGTPVDFRPPPRAAVAEMRMRNSGNEIYKDWPDDYSKFTFVQILDILTTVGMGHPLLAKETEALYIMHSMHGAATRPVWAVTFRGIPPIPVSRRAAEYVPLWQLNHIRNVVDGKTGKCLFATNCPQPE